MIVTTLLPERSENVWIDGFEVGGRKIEPVSNRPLPEGMGVGRFEVGDSRRVKDHLFVHVIEVADAPADPNAYEAPPAEVSAAVAGGVIEVKAAGNRIRFRSSGPGLVR